jgi:hypothetical protein
LYDFDYSKDRSQLSDRLDKDTWLGEWYETFVPINNQWVWLVEKILKLVYKDNIACGVIGMYPAYLAGVLEGT